MWIKKTYINNNKGGPGKNYSVKLDEVDPKWLENFEASETGREEHQIKIGSIPFTLIYERMED